MGIKSEKIQGKQIINEIESSNLVKTVYNLDEKTLLVTFKNGMETGVSRWYRNKEGKIIRFKVYKDLSNMYVNYERGEVKMVVYVNKPPTSL